MSDQVQAKSYLDYTGLSTFYNKLKERYDGSIKDLSLSEDGKMITGTTASGGTFELDTSKFVKDGMLSEVIVYTTTKEDANKLTIPNYGLVVEKLPEKPTENEKFVLVGEKFIKFVWNTDSGKQTEYIKTTEIGMTYTAGTGIEIATVNGKDSINVSDVPTNEIKTTEAITIDGGPLESTLKSMYGDVIPANTTLEDILIKLAQKEKWPSISFTWTHQTSTNYAPTVNTHPNTSTVGSYTVSATAPITTGSKFLKPESGSVTTNALTTGKNAFVGTTVKAPGATASASTAPDPKVKVSGFTWGHYNEENPNTKQSNSSITINATGLTMDVSKVSLNYYVRDSKVKSTNLSAGGATLSAEHDTWTINKGSNVAKYVVSGKGASGAVINNFTADKYKYYAVSNQGKKDYEYILGDGSKHTPTLYALSNNDQSKYANYGSLSGTTFTFKDDAATDQTAGKTTYTGYTPIFTNIIPLSKSTKGSITDAKFISVGKSPNTAALTFAAQENGTYPNVVTDGAYAGNLYLKPLPISYLREFSGAHEIGLGSAITTKSGVTGAALDRLDSQLKTLDLSEVKNDQILVIAVPEDITVQLLIQDVNDDTTWKADDANKPKIVGTINNTINRITYKCWAIMGPGKTGAPSDIPYIIRLSGLLN